MNLADLLKEITPIQTSGALDRPVRSLQYDSRRVEPGDVFFAWKGIASDGHHFIAAAKDRGAVAIVLENEHFISGSATSFIQVKNVRQTLAYMAAAYHNHPDRAYPLVGVTGTNGKTTTTFILKHLLSKSFGPVGLLGTVRYEIGQRVLPATRTTPESLDLFYYLNQIRAAKCHSAVMEVSSHALSLHRVDPLRFRVAIFTNLTQDHLDFHESLESYRDAKGRIFEMLAAPTKSAFQSQSLSGLKGSRNEKGKPGTAVLNLDDPTTAYYVSKLPADFPLLTYSANGHADADISAVDPSYFSTGTSGEIRFSAKAIHGSAPVTHPFSSPLLGAFNVANLLAAIAGALAVGVPLTQILSLLPTIPQVPGRLETFVSKDMVTAVVDYAHTDDAVRKALTTLREIGTGRLIVVLGCGGNRDAGKRPKMARAAVQTADLSVFTADNPRNENVESILDDMEAGLNDPSYQGKWERISERRQAIAHALAMARPGDVVCVAGKGHETTQEIAGQFHPFDDRLVVQEFLKRRVL